ncbi:alpha/beta hydrolase [Caniella muris]|uniref:alpha/beta hydrolase n=1 Tax=Caniella muris TaxID=2941502 RepID=UPI00203F57B7|nr:alpha/beta hydrolase [Caniella muris]
MEQRRTYDPGLVAAIRDNVRTVEVDGLPVEVKPIPDDDRDHVLDPRVRAVAARKAAMFEERAAKRGHGALSDERWRPDKETPDLTTVPIDQRETVVPIAGTHRILVHTYRREDASGPLKVVVYLHGGGFTAGDERIYRNRMRYIAEVTGALVVFPEYRLAPEAPFPAAIEDAMGTLSWVVSHGAELGCDPDRVMVVGDSAGGSLAAACALSDREGTVKRVHLIFPGCDMGSLEDLEAYEWSWDAYPVVEEDRELAYGRIRRIERSCHGTAEDSLYVQGRTSLRDPLVSVAYATDEQLLRFPPTTVAVSEYDYLRLGAEYFARRLSALGRPVRCVLYKGCDHGFFDIFGGEPQAEELCYDIADELALV